MKINKELVDNLIRLTKKYYRTSDTDILPALRKALLKAKDELRQECKKNRHVVNLIRDLAMFIQLSGKGTYEDIYKALEVFGVIVE